jgi:hypothetical protein
MLSLLHFQYTRRLYVLAFSRLPYISKGGLLHAIIITIGNILDIGNIFFLNSDLSALGFVDVLIFDCSTSGNHLHFLIILYCWVSTLSPIDSSQHHITS